MFSSQQAAEITGKAEDSDFIFTKLEHSNEEGKNKKREAQKVFLIFKKKMCSEVK